MLFERKIIITLTWLAACTIILFGLLAGTPHLTFSPVQIKHFYFTMLMISLTTLVFWVINIGLLLLSTKAVFLRKMLWRGVIGAGIGVVISLNIFHYFRKITPPPKVVFSQRMNEQDPAVSPAGPKMIAGNFTGNPAHAAQTFPDNPPRFTRMQRPTFFFFPAVLHSLTIDVIILILCELVFLYYKKEKIEHENLRLRQANTEARNNQLKMQLQPHFLFNSLNTLRLLLHQDTNAAEEYLLKLSTILRNSTRSALQTVTDVSNELELCITYLEMQKVRFGSMLHFSVSNEAIYKAEGKLPGYSLQLLVENALKHNTFTNENPLVISINYDHRLQEITVKNNLNPKKNSEASSKIGLLNLSERYWLLNHEKINVVQTDHDFTVTIKILQNQNIPT